MVEHKIPQDLVEYVALAWGYLFVVAVVPAIICKRKTFYGLILNTLRVILYSCSACFVLYGYVPENLNLPYNDKILLPVSQLAAVPLLVIEGFNVLVNIFLMIWPWAVKLWKNLFRRGKYISFVKRFEYSSVDSVELMREREEVIEVLCDYRILVLDFYGVYKYPEKYMSMLLKLFELYFNENDLLEFAFGHEERELKVQIRHASKNVMSEFRRDFASLIIKKRKYKKEKALRLLCMKIE